MEVTSKQEEESTTLAARLGTGILRIVVSILIPLFAFGVLAWSVTYMTNADAPKGIRAIVALIIGVGGIWVLYLAFDNLVSLLPEDAREKVRPFVFVGPALAILSLYLIYPVFLTTINSFRDARSEAFVGLDNFIFVFTDPAMLIVLRNNLIWLVFVTFFVVAGGLVIAVMVDRIRAEAIAKSIIFLPMAISAVGASVIWKFSGPP
jgi:alpha-glucoside transport system permease protein